SALEGAARSRRAAATIGKRAKRTTDPCIGTAGGAAHPADGGRCHGRRAWIGALSSRRPSCSVTAPGGTLSPHETTRGGGDVECDCRSPCPDDPGGRPCVPRRGRTGDG